MSGSIQRLKSGNYRVRYYPYAGSKQKSGGTYPTKALAQKALTKILHSIAEGTWEQELAIVEGDLDPRTVTLGQLAAHWREVRVSRNGQPPRPSTLREYERIINSTLLQFRDVPIRQITTQQIERWFGEKRKTAPNMASKGYKHLNTLMIYAVKHNYIKRNPCTLDGASTYRPPSEPDVPTTEQVTIMLENSPEPFKTFLALAADTGLRKGELLELRVKDFDTEKVDGETWLHVTVTRSVTFRKGNREAIVGPPKTATSVRRVAIPQATAKLVKAHIKKIPNISPEALLFANDEHHTEHWREGGYVRLEWQRVRATANYGGTFHSMRAYAATQFGLTGATTREIMERFGHKDLVTANRYQRTTGRETQLLKRL